MKYELKDWLNSINFTKENLIADDPEMISSYPPYIVNRCLSGHLDTVLFANEMNKYSNLDKDMQYSFFHQGEKRFRFLKVYSKKEYCKSLSMLLYLFISFANSTVSRCPDRHLLTMYGG